MSAKSVKDILKEREQNNLKTFDLGSKESNQDRKRITIYLSDKEYSMLKTKAEKNLKKVGGYVKSLVIESILEQNQ